MNTKENRSNRITIRLTDSELVELKANAASNDYLSISKYIRTVVLGRRIPIRKVTVTDRATRNQINKLTAEISKIGVNINQVVKKLNMISTATKRNGDPVINTRQLVYYIRALSNRVENVIEKQEAIINTVSESYPDEGTK